MVFGAATLLAVPAGAEPAAASPTTTVPAVVHHPNHHVIGWIVAGVAIVIVVGIFVIVRFRSADH